jgi:hypothetical protein
MKLWIDSATFIEADITEVMVLRAPSCSEESALQQGVEVTAHGLQLLNRTRGPTCLVDCDVFLETEGVTLRLRCIVSLMGSTAAKVQS